MKPADAVTWAALLAGIICFAIYVWLSIKAVRARPADAAHEIASKAAPGMSKALSIDEFAKLLEAMSKLTDSLGKAGPALTSLIGAILFFAVAAISSGALHSSPPQPAPPAKTAKGKEANPPADANQAATNTNTNETH